MKAITLSEFIDNKIEADPIFAKKYKSEIEINLISHIKAYILRYIKFWLSW